MTTCIVDGCDRRRYIAAGLCQVHDRNMRQRGDIHSYAPLTLSRIAINELWGRLTTPEALEDGDCWPWPGKARHEWGYGHTGRNGVSVASRAAWIQVHGPVPAGLWVLHRCDNPPCVRPSHLYLGTAARNTQDSIERGRWKKPPGNRRFSDKLIAEVRRRSVEGESNASISRSLEIEKSYVSRIVNGQSRTNATGVDR